MSSIVHSVRRASRRQRRGLTLIEAAMVLTILALVVAGVMLYFQSASVNRQVQEASGQLAQIQQAVRTAYAGQSSYTGLNNANIAQSLPRRMVAGANDLRHAFNNTAVVAPVGTGSSQFSVVFNGLPLEACLRLSTIDLGRSVVSLNVNGTTTTEPPLNPGAAQTQCNNNANALTWIFF